MAKWIEYLLKKKPADEDMLMLEDAETHNNKRVSFSGIADWLIEKMKKNNLISGALRFKGSSAYAALPGKGAAENDYYYCTDGDGTHGPGYYAWNGSSWIWIGNNDKRIDKSLKVEGAAAEAAATGEAIASLKEDLGNLYDVQYDMNIVAFHIVNGYWVNNNGKFIEDSSWSRSDFIKCDGMDTITIYSPVSHTYNAFYSDKSENAFIKTLSVIANKKHTIQVPPSAKYFVISGTNNNIVNMKVYKKYTIQSIETDMQRGFNDIQAGNIPFKEIPFSYVNGSNGEFLFDPVFSRTDYIIIDTDEQITISINENSNYNAFYDENKKFVSKLILHEGENDISIPTSAKYMCLSYHTATTVSIMKNKENVIAGDQL